MTVKIKICGLTNPKDVAPCIRSSVDYVGFVFHKSSKRNLELSLIHISEPTRLRRL